MRDRAPRRQMLGLGLDGHGLGPESADGTTRVTRGEDYLLLGGAEALHGKMQDLAETISEACRAEGTSLGEAPSELLGEILADLASGDDPQTRPEEGPPERRR